MSFLTTYHTQSDLLAKAAADLNTQLECEALRYDDEASREPARTMTAAVQPATGTTGKRRRSTTMEREEEWHESSARLVETRRRRRRNKGGQYVLEYTLRPAERQSRGGHDDNVARWVSADEYEVYFRAGMTAAGEIFQQDRWMNSSDEESNKPNKRVVDTQDRAQRNSEESQAEKTRDHKEE
ncbi:hypothetical protein L915_19009 [Phytophthora nicotianae]|uniref:Uncharacterized protein n=2 Tax=Phytophthora nicotianae TaxID=4792 RepID=W2FVP9_PHYNI|nr:hypothetical protein L915_19009 [Phytophthora nicotianae]